MRDVSFQLIMGLLMIIPGWPAVQVLLAPARGVPELWPRVTVSRNVVVSGVTVDGFFRALVAHVLTRNSLSLLRLGTADATLVLKTQVSLLYGCQFVRIQVAPHREPPLVEVQIDVVAVVPTILGSHMTVCEIRLADSIEVLVQAIHLVSSNLGEKNPPSPDPFHGILPP